MTTTNRAKLRAGYSQTTTLYLYQALRVLQECLRRSGSGYSWAVYASRAGMVRRELRARAAPPQRIADQALPAPVTQYTYLRLTRAERELCDTAAEAALDALQGVVPVRLAYPAEWVVEGIARAMIASRPTPPAP